MNELNLDFDGDKKNINMNTGIGLSDITLSTNINSPTNVEKSSTITPELNVSSDIMGVELLARPDKNSSEKQTTNASPSKSEEFNFFKSDDDTGGIVNGFKKDEANDSDKKVNIEDDKIIMNNIDNEYKPIHSMSPQEIKNEKIDLIYRFKKLDHQGIRTTMNYNMNSHLEDMRNEYIKLKKQREIENSVKFQRKMLMALVTGVEFLNSKFDPFSVKLDGWSESVNENVNDYDEIFEELFLKYGADSDMAPEIRLLFTLGGSAFMFHLTNTMFKSSIPGMDDVLKQNPDLMKQFAQAAVGSMNGGGQSQGPMNAMNMGHMNNNPSPPQVPSPPRSEMDGPDGIDDLITKMNLQPNNIPDLDNISLMSGDSDRRSNSAGITLNL